MYDVCLVLLYFSCILYPCSNAGRCRSKQFKLLHKWCPLFYFFQFFMLFVGRVHQLWSLICDQFHVTSMRSFHKLCYFILKESVIHESLTFFKKWAKAKVDVNERSWVCLFKSLLVMVDCRSSSWMSLLVLTTVWLTPSEYAGWIKSTEKWSHFSIFLLWLLSRSCKC